MKPINVEYPNVPERTIAALERYVMDGVPTGDFLRAVLSNDLSEAVAHADDENASALAEIGKLVYNRVPAKAAGSEDRVVLWSRNGGANGLGRVGSWDASDVQGARERFAR